MKKLWKKVAVFVAAIVLVGTLAACNSDGSKTIEIGQGDWESNEFHDAVASYIIENGYGVETNINSVDTPVMVQSLITGDIDLTTEMWTDNVASYHDDVAAGHYESISTNFDDNWQGIYIPQYLADENPGLQTVQDLPDYAHLFPTADGGDLPVIYGGPSGWAITAFLDAKVETYGLDEHFEFRPLESTATLNATLTDAYNSEEAWLGYQWEPTWIMGQLDMFLLEDEEPYDSDTVDQGIGLMPAIPVTIAVTDGFEEEYPEIHAFLSNYETSSAITSEALAYMQDEDASPEETAVWWLYNNQVIWTTWLSDDALDLVLAELEEDYEG